MFRILSGQLKPAVLFIAAVASLGSASVAHAGNLDACVSFLQAQDYPRAISEAKSLLKRKGLARDDERSVQLCLGIAQDATGRFRDALPAFLRVEALSRNTKELSGAYKWLGATYQNMGDLDRAELYIQRALKAHKALGDKSGESSDINSLAVLVHQRGDQERALALYKESLALESDEASQAYKLSNIATIHAKRSEYTEAVKLQREALGISRRQGDGHKSAIFQINLGEILRQQGDLAGAEQELTAGLKVIQLIGDQDRLATAYKYLAWLDEDRKDIPAAKEWYRKAELTYRVIGQTAKADAVRQALNQSSK